jgi:uncharacterized membrane protein YeiB
MVIILILFLFGIFGFSLILSDKDDSKTKSFLGVVILIICTFTGGFFSVLRIHEFEYKKPIKPTIKVKCIDGKCDTTYIYKFNDTK